MVEVEVVDGVDVVEVEVVDGVDVVEVVEVDGVVEVTWAILFKRSAQLSSPQSLPKAS